MVYVFIFIFIFHISKFREENLNLSSHLLLREKLKRQPSSGRGVPAKYSDMNRDAANEAYGDGDPSGLFHQAQRRHDRP